MVSRHLGGLTPALLIANTDSTGVATFTIPAGRMRRYEGCIATPKGAVTTRYTCQVVSEPAIGADLYVSGGTITVAVSTTNQQVISLLGATVLGMVAAGTGVPVMTLAWGS